MTKLVLTATALGAALLSTIAIAGPWGRGPGANRFAAAELTDEQTAQMDALNDACRQKNEPARNQLFAMRQEIRGLLAEASPNKDKILAKQKEIRDLQEEIQARALECELDRRAILTPEQQEKLAAASPCGGGGCGGGGWGRGGRGCDNRGW